ncbi:MAG: Hsp20 family protein, partial [Candidatus Dadabacteria bacterium]|nr:Hsp20 family protein [Candidatus Dadabacteria bacterium]
MELKKWKKNAEIEKFFETLMDEPFRNLIKNRFYNLEPLTRSGALKPSLDMIDKKDRLIVKAELPGINIDDVKISILDGVLNIKGETKEEKNIEKDEYYYSEITKGTYE